MEGSRGGEARGRSEAEERTLVAGHHDVGSLLEMLAEQVAESVVFL